MIIDVAAISTPAAAKVNDYLSIVVAVFISCLVLINVFVAAPAIVLLVLLSLSSLTFPAVYRPRATLISTG